MSSSKSFHTYQDYLAKWTENDQKAAEYIKENKHNVIASFYYELNFTKGELPLYITARSTYPSESRCKLYPRHNQHIVAMCKEVEAFIQLNGFPYRLNHAKSGFTNCSLWPIRCKFDLEQ